MLYACQVSIKAHVTYDTLAWYEVPGIRHGRLAPRGSVKRANGTDTPVFFFTGQDVFAISTYPLIEMKLKGWHVGTYIFLLEGK